jgi:hypothetical protein
MGYFLGKAEKESKLTTDTCQLSWQLEYHVLGSHRDTFADYFEDVSVNIAMPFFVDLFRASD